MPRFDSRKITRAHGDLFIDDLIGNEISSPYDYGTAPQVMAGSRQRRDEKRKAGGRVRPP
jgi:hypothetical protein